MDVNKLLDKCREVRSMHTDTALSLELGVSKQAVNDWRHGRKLPDEVSCARIADENCTQIISTSESSPSLCQQVGRHLQAPHESQTAHD